MARNTVRWAFGLVVGLSAAGCATSFVGDAQFPGGPSACWERCRKAGMEMGSFVYVGEYSTACACKPRVNPMLKAESATEADDEGSVVAATAGVEMQRRQQEAAAAASRPR